MEKMAESLTIVSLLTLIISFLNYVNARNNIISDVVAQDRIKWISDVRNLMFQFLENYLLGKNPDELRKIKSKIDLYIIYDKDGYINFERKLNYCISNPFTEKDYRELVTETQLLLNHVWIRVKCEAGITQRDEKKIKKILNKKPKCTD